MFTIYAKIQGSNESLPLHHPNLARSGNICVSPKLKERINSAGSLTFKVSPENPYYEDIKSRRMYVTVFDDGVEVWRGRVIDTKIEWNKLKTVNCEGEMAYLLDTMKLPFVFSGTPSALLNNLISSHNGSVGNDTRSFAVGTVQITTQIEISTDSAKTTWDFISTFLLKNLGGYVKTRKSNGTVYIDYLQDFPDAVAGQNVEFGKNMIDLQQKFDGADIITDLIPFGAKKNTAPRLYKRRSASSRYFDLFTGDFDDSAGGQYLIVANGAAMNKTLSSGRFGSNLVTFSSADTIQIPANNTDIIIWTIASQTVSSSESVTLSGSVSESVTLTDSEGNTSGYTQTTTIGSSSLKIGGGDEGQSSGSISVSKGTSGTIGDMSISSTGSSGSVRLTSSSTNGEEGWTISNGGDYIAGNGKEKKITKKQTNTTKETLWKISNGENGVTITNQYNSDLKTDAVLHGDVDYGFYCASSATEERPTPISSAQIWDAARVNIRRVNNDKYTLASADAYSLWGSHVYGTVVFDDVQTPSELLSAATAYLAQKFIQSVTISAKAVDLSLISLATAGINVGTYAKIISVLHDLDLRMLCKEKTTYLAEPDKTTIVFGAGQKTLTDLQGGYLANVR